VLSGLIGNSAGPLLVGLALLLAKFRYDLPGRATPEILLTAAIILTTFGGEVSRSTGLGKWITGVIHWGEHLMGTSASTGLALVTLAVVAFLARHILKTAGTTGLWLGFTVPFLLALFPVGIFHTLDVDLQGPAVEVAAAISHALGVS
jgi:hypothetical protein